MPRSSPDRLTQAERTARSDARMHEATLVLLLEKGVLGTTLKEVGERAGYSRGLAQNRFGSKDQLLERVVNRCYQHWGAELSREIGDAVGLAAFERCVAAFERFLLESPRELKVLQMLWYHSITHQSVLQDRTREIQERMVRDVERWMREAKERAEIDGGVDELDFAVRHMAFIFGIVYMWLLNEEGTPIKKTFASYLGRALAELHSDGS